MNLLREYIRETLLIEAAKGVRNLVRGVKIAMEVSDSRAKFYYYVPPNLSKARRPEKVGADWTIDDSRNRYAAVGWGDTEPVTQPRGQIELRRPPPRDGPCGDAWEVAWSEADQAWGPLLYDLAMEWATMNGGGLISDRRNVSPPARAVWDYYFSRRRAAKSHQLDDLENTLTPQEEDNCNQWSALGKVGGEDWQESPLSKRYTKSPTVWNQLIKGDKLVRFK